MPYIYNRRRSLTKCTYCDKYCKVKIKSKENRKKGMHVCVYIYKNIYISIIKMHNLFFNLLMIIPTLQKEYNN